MKLTSDGRVDVKHLALQKMRLEHEIDSIRDRVRDIEWRIDLAVREPGRDWMSERQSALDKLRHTQRELLETKEKLFAMGAMT